MLCVLLTRVCGVCAVSQVGERARRADGGECFTHDSRGRACARAAGVHVDRKRSPHRQHHAPAALRHPLSGACSAAHRVFVTLTLTHTHTHEERARSARRGDQRGGRRLPLHRTVGHRGRAY